MTIKVGDKLPEAKFRVMTAEGPQVKTTDDIFKGKKVALFAVPGAYTGTCHKMHLPSIFLNAYAIKDKGVNTIAIVSVNDVFVMNAWKRDTDQRDEAIFLADGNAEFAKAIGMELDASGNGLGIRSQPLLDAGGRRRGQEAQPRADPRQGRGVRRRHAARAVCRVQDFASALTNCRSRRRERVIQYSRRLRIDRRTASAYWITRSRRAMTTECSRSAFIFQPFNLAIATPSRANWSARSFSSWPAWPLTQCQRTWCGCKRRIEPLPQIDILDRLLVRRCASRSSSSHGSSR